MKTIIQYFEHVPDIHRVILLGGSLFFFGYFELLYEVKPIKEKTKHIFTNALFIFPAAPVQLGIGYLLILLIHQTQTLKFGLLYLLPEETNPIVYFLLSFFLLDFFEYIYHVSMHKLKPLWMAHLVHHSDRNLTVTTTLREHPMETFIRLTFLLIWVAVSGISFWALLFRQFIQIVSNVFAHANIRLSEPADRITTLLFVTPNMHQVHHHYKQPFTDSNYGDVLSIWDRLFNTYKNSNAEDLIFGVDTYFDKKENAYFPKLFTLPFGRYRSPNIELSEEQPREQIAKESEEEIILEEEAAY